MLVRHYIRQRLADYYAQPATAVVGSTKSSNSMSRWLFGEWHWQSSYNQLLRQHDGQWLTPVELFQPYYSNTIANFIMRTAAGAHGSSSNHTKNGEQPFNPSSSSSSLSSAASTTTSDTTSSTNSSNINDKQQKIEIIELGGGRGTNAQLILDHIYHTDRFVYNQIASYTMIDASPTLHDYQKHHLSSNKEQQQVVETKRIDHSSKMKFRCIDVVDIAEGRVPFFIRDDQDLGNDDDTNENNNTNNSTTNNAPIINNHRNDIFATTSTSNKTSHNNENYNNRRQQRMQQQQKQPKQQQQQQQIQTYIIACELLDNLPHDKISIQSVGGRTIMKQAELVPLCDDTPTTTNGDDGDSNDSRSNNSDTNDSIENKEQYYKEVFLPLSDELLKCILQIEPMEYNGDRSKNKNRYISVNNIQWIPTIAYGLLQQIYKEVPTTSQNRSINIVLADFDQLPFPDNIEPFHITSNNNDTATATTNTRSSFYAQNEPLVTCMDKHDYECYLQSPYLCDILYPTNFDNLRQFILSNDTINKYWNKNKNKKNDKNNSLTHHVRVLKQSEFLQQYGPEQIEMTKSWLTGYTPLLHDYCNCSVLTVTSHNMNTNGNTGKE